MNIEYLKNMMFLTSLVMVQSFIFFAKLQKNRLKGNYVWVFVFSIGILLNIIILVFVSNVLGQEFLVGKQ